MYPQSYHYAIAAMIAGHPRNATRTQIAAALRALRKTRTRAEVRREYRNFIFTAPGYFCRH